MSEEERAYTSVLLPSATIELFSNDAETVSSFQSLADDWRFPRVTLTPQEGDVETAIQRYGNYASPDLVVIETETIDSSFTDRLEALAGNCSEGTAAMIIGPVNDVNLYRTLVSMGVSDYLVKPLAPKAFAEHLAKALIDKIGASESALIAVIGAKGGVGTSALAQTLAFATSEKLGQKTFLMDAAGGWSTLPVGLDFEPAGTLAEAAKAVNDENFESLERMFIRQNDKLTVLGSGSDEMLRDNVDPDDYEGLFNHLMVTYPVVIADLSQSPSALRHVVLSRAHKILVVATPLLPAVRAARSLIQEIKDIRGKSDDHLDVIMNMHGVAPKFEVSKKQMEEGLDRTIPAVIDYNAALFVGSESKGNAITEDKEAEKVVAPLLLSLRDILQVGTGSADSAAVSTEAKSGGGFGSLLSKITKKS